MAFAKFQPQQQGEVKRRDQSGPTPESNVAPAFDFMFDGLSAALQSVVPKIKRQESIPVATPSGPRDHHFDTVPLDWSIMNRVRFTSSQSFFWSSTCSAQKLEKGLRETLCQTEGASDDDLAVAFHKASLYWMHPSCQLSARNPILAATQNASAKAPEQITADDAACIQFMHQRWMEWEDSFRSLYYGLRTNNACRHFFYECSTFMVLFLGPSAPHLDDSQAIIASSTPSLRSLLAKAEVRFTRPFFQEAVGEDDTKAEDFEGVHVKRPPKRPREENEAAAAVLQISGKADVHALYDILLNFNKRLGDIPVLYSDTAFVGATLKTLQVSRNNEVARRGVAEDERFCLDIQGPVLPRQWVQLCHVLSSSHKKFRAYLWPRAGSVCFNLLGLPQLQSLGLALTHSPLAARVALHEERGVAALRKVDYDSQSFAVQVALPTT